MAELVELGPANVWLLECLEFNLQSDPCIRIPAQEALNKASSGEGYGPSILAIALNRKLARGVRHLAALTLKDYVVAHWHPKLPPSLGSPTPICEADKEAIRKHLPQALQDSDEEIRKVAGITIAVIAKLDWPQDWPDLMVQILRAISHDQGLCLPPVTAWPLPNAFMGNAKPATVPAIQNINTAILSNEVVNGPGTGEASANGQVKEAAADLGESRGARQLPKESRGMKREREETPPAVLAQDPDGPPAGASRGANGKVSEGPANEVWKNLLASVRKNPRNAQLPPGSLLRRAAPASTPLPDAAPDAAPEGPPNPLLYREEKADAGAQVDQAKLFAVSISSKETREALRGLALNNLLPPVHRERIKLKGYGKGKFVCAPPRPSPGLLAWCGEGLTIVDSALWDSLGPSLQRSCHCCPGHKGTTLTDARASLAEDPPRWPPRFARWRHKQHGFYPNGVFICASQVCAAANKGNRPLWFCLACAWKQFGCMPEDLFRWCPATGTWRQKFLGGCWHCCPDSICQHKNRWRTVAVRFPKNRNPKHLPTPPRPATGAELRESDEDGDAIDSESAEPPPIDSGSVDRV